MPVLASDNDIQYAEQVLFGRTGIFDEERIDFIKHRDTCDLQAVPGSGKTTALLAKLLILEQKLPFEDGRGVLVISHTNAAVNEITKKISKHCPRLFQYPHFIGTIQSFVDQFLCAPYFSLKYKRKISRIDNEIYEDRMYMPYQAKGWCRNNERKCEALIGKWRIKGLDDSELVYPFEEKDLPIGKDTATIKAILHMKQDVRRRGYLSFEDAFILAFEYINRFPKIKQILQRRFKHVFVDEMQDMAKHQYEILEEIFFANGTSTSSYQRIGDKNQAIYSTDSDFAEVWTTRTPTLELNASHRLHPHVAKVVQYLALDPITVTGKFKNRDGSEVDIKPHLLVYDTPTIHNVIPKFVELTKGYVAAGKIPADFEHPVKAICWTTKAEDAKVRIGNYYAAFNKKEEKLSISYPCLEAYLYEYDKSKRTIATIRKNILNAFLKILRLENVTEFNSLPLTKRRLLDYLNETYPVVFGELKLNLFQWCMMVVKGQASIAVGEIKAFAVPLLNCFGKTASSCMSFLNDTYHPLVVPAGERTNPLARTNVFSHEGIDVEIGTVHSVKGQTHTATLYMESFYERSSGGGSYESERLAEPLKGNALPANAPKFTKQSMKMAYVGFSRPTHFLCFAVHKSRFDAKLTGIGNDWEIVEVT